MNDNLIGKELMSTELLDENNHEEEKKSQHDENVDMHEVLYKAIFLIYAETTFWDFILLNNWPLDLRLICPHLWISSFPYE